MKPMLSLAAALVLLQTLTFTPGQMAAQAPVNPAAAAKPVAASQHPIPTVVEKNGRHALMVDGKPYLVLGFQANNSSAWPAYFDRVFPAADILHVNTVEAPVYWEQMEPAPGRYDFSVVDGMLAQARRHKVHMVLLWFGTWKNGSSHYNPQWMKTDAEKYPFVLGKNGQTVDSPSVYSPARLEGDKRAFAALMRHLRAADADRTVLMVQVENEAGIWGGLRDFGAQGEKEFAEQVPAKLVAALGVSAGTWQQVFGEFAEGSFEAWKIAGYIEQVAAAGKAEYALPLYVNAALRDPFHARPGSYESGAPTDENLRIYQVAAPSLALIAPDIYLPEYANYIKVIELYKRFGNALLIPETGNSLVYAHYVFAAVGQGALGFAPFGLDLTAYSNLTEGADAFGDKAAHGPDARLAPFANEYALLEPIAGVLAQAALDGTVQGGSEDPATHVQTLDFRRWQAELSYGLPAFGNWMKPKGNTSADGGAVIVQLGDNEFLVAGHHVRVDFKPTFDAGKKRYWMEVDEGSYNAAGKWTTTRIWNGDQTDYGLNLRAEGNTLLRVKVTTF